jgi:hypothetical protein
MIKYSRGEKIIYGIPITEEIKKLAQNDKYKQISEIKKNNI